jgi:tetratricopeptide (TPR) repeat protein
MRSAYQGNSGRSMFLGRWLAMLLAAFAAPDLPGAAWLASVNAMALDTTNEAASLNPEPGPGKPTSDDTLAQSILNQLLAVAPGGRSSGFASWPPKLDVISSSTTDTRFEGVGKYNAFASAENCIPWIRITDGLIHDVIEGDRDRLALVLGHELSHILLGHTSCEPAGPKPSFLRVTFTREQEFAADKNGLILMQRAGYSSQKGLKVFQVMDAKFGYCSFEALRTDHPSMKDRLAALDKDQASLWQSMSAFETGVFFLAVEQYASAEDSFTSVVKAYPDAAEAWLNLGYSRLMRYADAMTTEDIARLGFERVVAGGFFRRPDTLAAKVRGVDSELWSQALVALRRAAALKTDSPIVKEALGVAYLLSPQGPQPDRAIPELKEALRLVGDDTSTDSTVVVSIKINLAAALEAAQSHQEARDLLVSAQQDCRALRKNSAALYFDETAILYNYGRSFGPAPDQKSANEAVELLDQYLSLEDPTSAWWPIAYKRYQLLADKFQIPKKAPQEIERASTIPHRPVVSLELGKNSRITIGQPMSTLPAGIGKGVQLNVDAGSELKRVRYPSSGIELVGNSRLLAISLTDSTSPPVQVKRFGTTAKSELLRVGMDLDSLRSVIEKEPVAVVPFMDLKEPYYFLPYLGLGLRLDSRRQVSEILIAQIPVAR